MSGPRRGRLARPLEELTTLGRPPVRWLRILFSTLLPLPVLLWALGALSYALVSSLEFAGIPYDGAFQILNPLRRLAAGQTPGVDFQFFHGIGIPLLHYPLFALLGSNIYASEFTRAAVTPLMTLLSTFTVAWVAGTSTRERALFVLLAFLGYTFFELDAILLPGNALEGTRSTMPFFAFAALYSGLATRRKAVLAGAAMAAGIALGTEHGVALVLGFTGAAALTSIASPNDRWSNLRFAGLTLAAFGCVLIALYVVIGRGVEGALAALHYNLVEVPADQIWYFGVPPNFYPETWAALILQVPLYMPVAVGVLALIGVLVVRNGRANLSLSTQTGALIVLLVYGLCSTLPYLSRIVDTYHQPIMRALLVAALTAGFAWVRQQGGATAVLARLSPPSWATAIGVGAFCLATFYGTVWITARADTTNNVVKVAKTLATGSGPHLTGHWVRYMDAVTKALGSGPTPAESSTSTFIWSTYSGLAASHYGLFQPGDDFIIHALGPTRRPHYVESFRAAQPTYVETLRRAWFTYEDWLRFEHWDFYEDILQNYQVILVTEHSIWWRRNPGGWRTENQDCQPVELDPDGRGASIPDRFRAPGAEVSVVSAEVRYRIRNPWQAAPFFSNLPRFLVDSEGAFGSGPVSLPPYMSSWRFPVFLERPPPGAVESTAHLTFETSSLLPGTSYQVTGLCLRTLALPASAAVFLESLKRQVQGK